MNEHAENLEEFEEAVRRASEGHFVFKLYVGGSSTRSAQAISNVKNICEEHLSGRYDLEVIDVFQQPELAHEQQLLAAPTLIKEQPEPLRRLVGDMSNTERVLHSLNILKEAS